MPLRHSNPLNSVEREIVPSLKRMLELIEDIIVLGGARYFSGCRSTSSTGNLMLHGTDFSVVIRDLPFILVLSDCCAD